MNKKIAIVIGLLPFTILSSYAANNIKDGTFIIQ